MFFAELRDDVSAGSMAIAENTGNIGLLADGLNQFRGKGVALRGEITPVEGDRRSGDFPMT
ncbi:hypothetical protein D3C72_2532350 [compost metagenome]